jgi:hypothetical protein
MNKSRMEIITQQQSFIMHSREKMCYWDNQMNEYGVGKVYSTHGDIEYADIILLEICEATRQCGRREDNIKTDIRE